MRLQVVVTAVPESWCWPCAGRQTRCGRPPSFRVSGAGAPLEEGQKSVSFRLTVGSPERTLSSEEVGEIRARIIEGMRELGYELRV
jgi:hypothetical protein